MHFYKFFLIPLFFITSLFAFEEGYVYNDDIKIVYRDYGPKNAEPILLVQGLGGQLINWPDHIIDFLIENNYRPIVFDNRDTGLSSRINSDLFSDKRRTRTISTTRTTGIEITTIAIRTLRIIRTMRTIPIPSNANGAEQS